ncbi:IclR family transcriptional regulator [Calidifontibacillus erzurumensis]|uniref:IclR family transcriptional regulator n=1 Tax=Calidifontibacillus erzurumensis TaxID=2741433 RepID=UPI0035B5432A
MEVIKSNTTIQALQTGIGILEVIAKHDKPLKFSEIAELTNISKSYLYKYLNTFIQLGFLYRDQDKGTYELGSKLIEFGMIAADRENVVERITPYLREISKHSSCTVTYSIWTSNGPMIINIFNSFQGINIGAQVGTILPITSAAGKIFLAFHDHDIIKEWKEAEFKKLSPAEKEKLENELEHIRRSEFSFAKEPIIASVSSVSFPVLNFKNNLLGAVAVVGFSEQISDDENDELNVFIKEMRRKINDIFGH